MCVTSVCDLNGKMSISGVKMDKVTETRVTDKDLSWANILPHTYTTDTRRTDHPPNSSQTGSARLKQTATVNSSYHFCDDILRKKSQEGEW